MRAAWQSASRLLAALVVAACHKAPAPAAQAPGAIPDSTFGAVATDSAAQSAGRFAQAFYDWYQSQGERFEVALKDSPAAFAPGLLAAMNADIAAQAATPDEVVGLDWDPFLATQDPCDPYRVGRTTRRADTILVTVRGMCADRQPGAGPDVVAELGRSNGRWVFLDFRHAGDAGSLLQDLAALRAERAGDKSHD